MNDTALEPIAPTVPEPDGAPAPAAFPPQAAPEPPAAPDPFTLAPVSPDDPWGPDLDFAGDSDFLKFVTETEGLLPAKPENYYQFKRETIDFPTAFTTAEKLLKRTLDVRLLTLAAKLSLLNRDVAGFARRIGTLAWLLREHWENAHPRAEGDDYSVRLGQLMALDDTASVVLPLQYAPLLEMTREGAFSYRDQLVATGAAQPRSVMRYNEKGEKETSADEKLAPQKIIEKILREIEIEKLAAATETLRGLGASLQSIRSSTAEHVGFENSVELPKLAKLVGEMMEFLRSALVARDPTLAPPPQAPAAEAEEGAPERAPAGPPPAFATRVEVDTALASALGYFTNSEPTSPALLLIRQARETLGKNLYEVMKLLAPPHADAARVFVGPDGVFTVPVKSLANVPGATIEHAPADPAASRAAALALIDAVANHMRKTEPSSPVPYLLERARSLATRDFLSLLIDVLPDDAIAALKKGK
jgi:type VI secretion system protein ImpA